MSRVHSVPALAIASLLAFEPAASAGEPTLSQLSWLAGCWTSVDGEPGTGEHWLPLAGESLLGVSRTVQDGKTAFYEFMRIERDAAGRITFFAQPRGAPPSAFPATRITDDAVTFENPAHDFPQRIGYRFAAPGTLHAYIQGEVGGQARREDFHYTRAPCAGE